MTDPQIDPGARWRTPEMEARVRRRNNAERRFRRLGAMAIGSAVAILALLLASIVSNGYGAFWTTEMKVDIHFDPAAIDPIEGLTRTEREEVLSRTDFAALIRNGLRREFPDVRSRSDVRQLQSLVSAGARQQLRNLLVDQPALRGRTTPLWLPADDEVDRLGKDPSTREIPEAGRRLSDAQISWIDALAAKDRIRTTFNRRFFTSGDSREPELAGILGATIGSLLTLVVTLGLVLPLGVSTAIYLEEFAPENRWTDLIEININNLAAVPSIVFGLLGLALFLNTMGLPRSAPLVGGATLGLMTLPTVIIVGRAAIKAVPPSIREAARGLGASPLQVVFHHVLPLAMPGILTGTIISMARALGETAPLLMIGMVAFVVDLPGDFTSAATALPVLIFLWADSPERAFVEKTSGAILVLLVFLVLMNAVAIALRQRLEKRW